MNEHRISLIVVVVCLVSTVGAAQQFHKQLSATEKEHILDSSFTMVARTEAMPANVKQAFAKITGEPSFALANPGQKYQVTDVVVDRDLPFRRLVFAGVEADEWFVHYGQGARADNYIFHVFNCDSR